MTTAPTHRRGHARAVLAAAALTLVATPFAVLSSAPQARAATALPYTVVVANQQEVTLFDATNGAVNQIGYDFGSSDSVTVNSAGTGGYVDKGYYAPTFGKPDHDARVYPLGLSGGSGGSIDDSVLLPCQGPNLLTFNPDGTQIAMWCEGDGVVKVLNSADLSDKYSYPLAKSEQVDALAWSADGSRLWIGGNANVYVSDNGAPAASHAGGIQGLNLRVFAGDPTSVYSASGDIGNDQFLEHYTDNGGSVGFSESQIPGATSGGGFLQPTPDGLYYYTAGTARLSKIRISDGSVVANSSPSAFGLPLVGLSTDPSGTNVVEAGGNNKDSASILIADGTTGTPVHGTEYDINTNKGEVPGAPAVTTVPPPSNVKLGYSGGLVNTPITFTASATVSPGTTIANYHWTWGDGSTDDTATNQTTHTYAAASDNYPVSVTVTDSLGQGGAGTGFWDGVHWVTLGSSTATATGSVYVGVGTQLSLTIKGFGNVGGHIAYGSTIELDTVLSPGNANYGIDRKIHFFQGGTEFGSSTFGDDGQGHQVATYTGAAVGDPGDHTFSANYEAMTPGNVQPAQSNGITLTVDHRPSNVTVTTPKPRVPSGAGIPVTATLGPNCGSGTYDFYLDGKQVTAAGPDTENGTSATYTIPGAADGQHAVTVAWTPDSADYICGASTSPALSVAVGAAPTPAPTTAAPTTPAPSRSAAPTATPASPTPTVTPVTLPTTVTLTGPAAIRPGPATLTAAVTTPGGGVLAGTVTVADAGKPVASVPLGAGGLAALPVTLKGYGVHRLTATFAPTTPLRAPSASPALAVLVDDKPAKVGIRGTSGAPGALTVALLPVDAHGSPVTSYSLTCTAPKLKTAHASGRSATFHLRGLRDNVDYRCTAVASNAVGTGPVSAPAKGRPGRLPSVTLTTAAPVTGYRITLTGTVTAADQPQANRPVTVTVRALHGRPSKVAGRAVTNAKGAYSLTVTVTGPSVLRATAPVGLATPFSHDLTVTPRPTPRAF